MITNYTSLCHVLDEMISQNEVTQMNGDLEFSMCQSLFKHFESWSKQNMSTDNFKYRGIKVTFCSELLMNGQIVLHEAINDLITNHYQ